MKDTYFEDLKDERDQHLVQKGRWMRETGGSVCFLHISALKAKGHVDSKFSFFRNSHEKQGLVKEKLVVSLVHNLATNDLIHLLKVM